MGSSKQAGRFGSTKNFRVCSIVPPFTLESIAANATGREAKIARESLLITARLAGQRDVGAMRVPSLSPGVKQRSVFDARFGSRLPGMMRRREGAAAVNDASVDEAYNGAGLTYDLYNEVFGRNSLDGQGMRLNSTVKYQKNYLNAFWNGTQMVYGDGDGRLFNRFTVSLDVCGHELTHGLTQFTSNLQYQDQSGAINESLSDVFGSLVKQRLLLQTADKADWVIGAGLLTDRVNGTGIRNMLEPGTAYDDAVLGKDPQPATMAEYLTGDEDSGQVHGNSGIPNRAFAVASVAAGGYAWDGTGRVWYEVATRYLTYLSNFSDLAFGTVSMARNIFGEGSVVHEAVKAGWDEVKIRIPSAMPNGRPAL